MSSLPFASHHLRVPFLPFAADVRAVPASAGGVSVRQLWREAMVATVQQRWCEAAEAAAAAELAAELNDDTGLVAAAPSTPHHQRHAYTTTRAPCPGCPALR